MVSWSFYLGTVLFTVASANECTDDPDFKDEDDYSCEDWKGYKCENALFWGLSEEGKQDLIDSCCKSCNPPKITYPEDCKNDAGFKDVKGYECEDWVGYSCEDYWNGYSDEDMQDVRDNCCSTCSTHCADNWLFIDQEGYRCGDWKGYDCRKAVEDWEYTQDAEDKLKKECCATCSAAIVAEGCEDDAKFEDELGYACEDWEGYSCIAAAEVHEYSEEGEQEILDNCCRTCTASCTDGYFFTDAKGYSCKDWEGYNCNTAVDEWEYTDGEAADILDNCCKTCAAFEGESAESSESEDGDNEDDEKADGPLNFAGYVELCENTTDEQTCKDSGCKYKKKAKEGKNCSGAKTQKKVKCKKITDEAVCGRIGCAFKNGKCKGKPDNF